MNDLKVGVVQAGIRHASHEEPESVDAMFSMVKEKQVFDYIDATPLPEQVADFERCAQQYDIPILAGSSNYVLGREEQKLLNNLKIGASLGSIVHNTHVFMDHADGYMVTNDEIMGIYLDGYEYGEKIGCVPTFEVHVNAWSERFSMVWEVAQLVQARGVPFRMTLDYSHVIFKIDNPIEQKVCAIDKDIANGDLILEPDREGNICQFWIDQGLVAHAHARTVAVNNPKNISGRHPDLNKLLCSEHPKSEVGRGIQYPFIEPKEGEWHTQWHADAIEPSKMVMRSLMAHHASTPSSELKTISTEFIPFIDYGQGTHYSLIDNNAACAEWIKNEWREILVSTE